MVFGDFTCECPTGLSGKNCSLNIDDCIGVFCGNGTCVDLINDYMCDCAIGFNGTNCTNNIDDCSPGICNNGDCIDQVNNYTCSCFDGYTGDKCLIDIDECATDPCVNGTCVNLVNAYMCNCTAGFDGTNCSNDINDCAPNPCVHGSCTDRVENYTCACDTGFTGRNCSIDINDCDPNPCDSCGNCTDLLNDYNCTCPAGFSGKNCSIDINECTPGVCGNGTCVDKLNGYYCDCDLGFNGTNCLNNIDDCAINHCANGGTCVDGVANYTCQCAPGHTGYNCSIALLSTSQINIIDVTQFSMLVKYNPVPDAIYYIVKVAYLDTIEQNKTTTNISVPVNGLLPGRVYSVSVYVMYVEGISQASDVHQQITVADNVTNLFVYNVTSSALNVRWALSAYGHNSTLVKIFPDSVPERTVTTNSTHFSNLLAGTNYTVSVQSQNAAGLSAPTTFSFQTAPGKPENVRITTAHTSLNISFDAMQGAVLYRVTISHNLAKNTTSTYVYFDGLNDGMQYTVSVVAFSRNQLVLGVLSSLPSDPISISTYINACKPSPCVNGSCLINKNNYTCECEAGFTGMNCSIDIDDCKPNPCVNGSCTDQVNNYTCSCDPTFKGRNCSQALLSTPQIKITDITQFSMLVEYEPVSDAIYYTVKVAHVDMVEKNITSTNISVPVNGLLPGRDYSISVYVMYVEGISQASDVHQQITVADNLTNLLVYDVTSYSINVIWTLAAYGQVSTLVKIFPGSVPEQTVTTNSTHFSNLLAGTNYTVSVQSQNAAGLSAPTNFSFQTAPGKPENVRIVTAHTSLNISFDAMQGAVLYRVTISPNLAKNTTSTHVSFHGLNDGMQYTVSVVAFSPNQLVLGVISSLPSDPISISTYINSCTPNPCMNGKCSVDKNNYTCECEAGFTGRNCSIDIDDCSPNPCVNSMDCIDRVNDYQCDCTPGFVGKNCEKSYDDCHNVSCNSFECVDGFLSYTCNCKNGYSGKNCEIEPSICYGVECKDRALCVNGTCVCKDGYDGNGDVCIVKCETQNITGDSGTNYTFIGRPLGRSNSVQKCNGSRSIAEAECKEDGDFHFLNELPCSVNLGSLANNIQENVANITAEQVHTYSTQVTLLTSNFNSNTSESSGSVEQVEEAANLITQLSNVSTNIKMSVETTTNFLLAVSNVGTAVSSPTSNEIPQNETAIIKRQLAKAVTVFVESMELPPDELENEIILDTMSVKAKRLPSSLFASQKKRSAHQEVFDITSSPYIGFNRTHVSPTLSFPYTLLRGLSRSTTFKMVLFKSTSLFPTKQKDVSKFSQVTQFVISGNNNSYGGKVQLINNDIKVTPMQPVPSKPQRLYQLECAKYNQNTEDWDKKDCEFEPGVGTTPSRCQCDSKYNPYSEEIEEQQQGSTFSCLVKEVYFPSAKVLSIVSKIGLWISLFGVFLTFVIYISIKQLRNRQPTIFILNICVCLFIVYITFLFGIQATETKTTCDASAMILHYALLAFWFWCGANTLNLYKLIVKVFGSPDTLTPCVLYSTCYGLPLLIVGINAGATIFTTDLSLPEGEDSNYRHSAKCWLRHYSLYFGFLLPMGLIILFNVVVFVLVISKLTCKRDKIRSSKSQKNSAKEGLSLAVTLCFMMGFAWIFGYFLLIDGDLKLIEVMSWLFTLFNAGQGITIFYFNCLKQNQARRLWLDPLLAQCCNKKPITKVESVELSQTTNLSKL
uniref:uncharacterized protein LOC100184291 isoform X3 n=1 Tax=Ciona intestinalis TaxID=7719 RepID=UPI000EF4BD0D|nr:uncharacterized protein LOC100184291 isoform X3 [Ciona intestinalis]|eukprot:XP_026690955.1 uncharacterized protein LOC100184291 isoform X3 [Ciona intestinalis]